MKINKFIKIKKENGHFYFFDLDLLKTISSEPCTQNHYFFAILITKENDRFKEFWINFDEYVLKNFQNFLEDDRSIFEFQDTGFGP